MKWVAGKILPGGDSEVGTPSWMAGVTERGQRDESMRDVQRSN